MQKLVAHSADREQSDTVHEKIQTVIQDNHEGPKSVFQEMETSLTPSLPFGEKELDELSHIFQGQQAENDHFIYR